MSAGYKEAVALIETIVIAPKNGREVKAEAVYVHFLRPIQWRSELFDGFKVTASANGKTLDVVQKKPTYLNYINESSSTSGRCNTSCTWRTRAATW